jgi:hypothetical protein
VVERLGDGDPAFQERHVREVNTIFAQEVVRGVIPLYHATRGVFDQGPEEVEDDACDHTISFPLAQALWISDTPGLF